MLSYETVEPRTLELLKSLMQEAAFNDMRLVGGTALALQYGHRQSVDLDFFGDLTCEQEITQEIDCISNKGQDKKREYTFKENLDKYHFLENISEYTLLNRCHYKIFRKTVFRFLNDDERRGLQNT